MRELHGAKGSGKFGERTLFFGPCDGEESLMGRESFSIFQHLAAITQKDGRRDGLKSLKVQNLLRLPHTL